VDFGFPVGNPRDVDENFDSALNKFGLSAFPFRKRKPLGFSSTSLDSLLRSLAAVRWVLAVITMNMGRFRVTLP
jgi:hypothetical protein